MNAAIGAARATAVPVVRAGDATPLGTSAGLAYGALGLPLAFVALPHYVVLPNQYATQFGMPLAALGVVLLMARLLDAFADPLIGRLADALFARSSRAAWLALARRSSRHSVFTPCSSRPCAAPMRCSRGALRRSR